MHIDDIKQLLADAALLVGALASLWIWWLI